MEIIDLLNELRESIPLIQNTLDESFLVFLEKHLKKVYLQLEKVDQEQLEEIAASFNWNREQLCHNFDYLTRMIIKSIKMFYDGKPASAYNLLKNKVLNVVLDDSGTRYFDYRPVNGMYRSTFYRIRKKESASEFNTDDLYHIPFHKRTTIKPQRFSIQGQPCLYLSTSIFTCWLEMDKPNLNGFYVSQYKSKEAFCFINLTIPPMFSDTLIKEKPLNAFLFLITYPLIAASLVKVKNINDPFKPEYIIPQLLLQFARNEKGVDGIIYSSTKIVDNINSEAWNYSNVVIPVLSNKESGYCEKLRKKFDISTPFLVEDSALLIPIMSFLNNIEEKMND